MNNDESLANDGIAKEFYVQFQNIVEMPLCASIQESLIVSELSTPQKILNIDMKLIWKVKRCYFYHSN